jgi:hypothetical protein
MAKKAADPNTPERNAEGRFVEGWKGGPGRPMGSVNKNARVSKLNLEGQISFIQEGINFLPELMEFLQSRVREESCITSAKIIIDKCLPSHEAAGQVIAEKIEALEDELERCQGVLEEQAKIIEDQGRALAMGKVA